MNTLQQLTPDIPTRIMFGFGVFTQLPHIIAQCKWKKIVIVTGKNIRKRTLLIKNLCKKLKNNNIHIFSDVETNPEIAQVVACINILKSFKADGVIAIGGGSVLDLAKASALLVKNPGEPENYFLKKKPCKHPGIPVIAVPTTAGTSSEITPFSVITFPAKRTKITLNSSLLYPIIAVVDPNLSMSAPSQVIAASGIDILSHAFEAFWNKQSLPKTDFYAVKAIKLVFNHLEDAYQKKKKEAFKNLCRAALYAGIAFSHTKTTGSHAISYPLTTIFGIPHGIACGLTLPDFLLFNASALKKKLPLLAYAINIMKPAVIAHTIRVLMRRVGCSVRLRDYGIEKKDLPTIFRYGYIPEKLKNNIRPITKQQIRHIIENIW